MSDQSTCPGDLLPLDGGSEAKDCVQQAKFSDILISVDDGKSSECLPSTPK